jgi:hypothetical protein
MATIGIRAILWGCILSFLPLMPLTATAADTGFEQPGEYRAGVLLKPEMAQGRYHKVDDRVGHDGFLYRFSVQSSFGPYEVTSLSSLAALIRELDAIAAMKQVETSDTVMKSLQQSGENAVQGVTNLFNDPEGTLRGAGQGISSLFNRASETVGNRQLTETEDSRMKQVLGVTKSKGEIATRYGVSIYSRNRTLQAELDRLAMADYLGGISVGLATSAVPGVGGLVLSTSGTARLLNETINTTAASELWLKNKNKLLAMKADADSIELFLNNPVFTPALQTVLVAALEELPAVANLELFIKVGLQASSPEMARVITEMAVMAAGYHKHVAPLTGFSPMARLVRATRQDGTVVVLLPTDHMIWTERVAAVAGDLVTQGRTNRSPGFEIWTLGTFSDRARTGLKAMGWQTHEQARSTLVPKE